MEPISVRYGLSVWQSIDLFGSPGVKRAHHDEGPLPRFGIELSHKLQVDGTGFCLPLAVSQCRLPLTHTHTQTCRLTTGRMVLARCWISGFLIMFGEGGTPTTNVKTTATKLKTNIFWCWWVSNRDHYLKKLRPLNWYYEASVRTLLIFEVGVGLMFDELDVGVGLMFDLCRVESEIDKACLDT